MSAPGALQNAKFDKEALDQFLSKAALLDTFDFANLSAKDMDDALLDAIARRSTELANGRYRVRDGVRAQYLRRLVENGSLRDVRAQTDAGDSPRQRYLDSWLLGDGVDWETMSARELRLALQVLRWLEPLPESERPGTFQLEGRLRNLERLVPLEAMATDFCDRSRQMRRMRDYVDGDDGSKPLMLYGIGGAGKSALIAKFLLEMDKRDKVAWVHLDLDSHALDMNEPMTLLEELIDQLSDQDQTAIRISRQAVYELSKFSNVAQKTATILPDLETVQQVLQHFGSIGTVVIVLDTFERAQSRDDTMAQRLLGTMLRVLDGVPNSRLVLSGRVQAANTSAVKVGDLPPAEAKALLKKLAGIKLPAKTVDRLVTRIGRLPLTLLLAADVLKRIAKENDNTLDAIDELAESVDENLINGFLYARLLGHLQPGESYRRLAHATLALPAFNEDLLLEVIAPACGTDADEARDFARLIESEVAFVRQFSGSASGWFAHRNDLREQTLVFLDRSLADIDVSRDDLTAGAREYVERKRDEIPARVLELFDGAPVSASGRAPQRSDVLDRARGRLERGDAKGARDLLLPARKLRLSAEGAEILAQSNFELGDLNAARNEALVSIRAALDEGDLEKAIEVAVWATDFLDAVNGPNVVQPVDVVLERGVEQPILRLRLLAANAAARRRRLGNRVPSSLLMEAWQATPAYDRESDTVLLGRLAGLLSIDMPATAHEALETVGLADLEEPDWQALAAGLEIWDTRLTGDPDTLGPIASMFDLGYREQAFQEKGVEAPRQQAWLAVLEERGGEDAAGVILKAMYSFSEPETADIRATLQDIYASRDDRRLVRGHTVTTATDDGFNLGKLTSHQRHSLTTLLAETFSGSELLRVAVDDYPQLAEDIPPNADPSTVAYALVSNAEAQNILGAVLSALASYGGSVGLDRLIRQTLQQSEWDDRTSPERLGSLLEEGGTDAAAELVEHLVSDLETTERPLPVAVAWRVYRTLRDYRQFEQLQELTEVLWSLHPEHLRYASMHAVALTEAGRPTDAIEKIMPLYEQWAGGKTPTDEDVVTKAESAMLAGALGQAYERLYLGARPNSVEPRQHDLDRALTFYERALHRDPATGFDLGVRALALKSHAEKTRKRDPEAIHPEAKELAGMLAEYLPEDDEIWASTSNVELQLATGNADGAVKACRALLALPDLDRFRLERLQWRLEQVWMLDSNTGIGAQLLPVIRIRQAQLKGGSITIDKTAELLDGTAEKADTLEAVFGQASYEPADWMRRALVAASSVGRMEFEGGTAIGSAVLLDPALIGAGVEGPLLLTSAHLAGLGHGDPDAGLGDCVVTFANPESGTGSKRDRVRILGERFSSPVDELDFTLLALDALPDYVRPATDASLPNELYKVLPGDRVTLVGYPGGRELAFSLQDSSVVAVSDSMILYTNPSQPGSGGGPVYSRDWTLVGLHRGRDANRRGHAIRMDRILAAARAGLGV